MRNVDVMLAEVKTDKPVLTDDHRNAYCADCAERILLTGENIRIRTLKEYETYVRGYYSDVKCWSCGNMLHKFAD